MSTGYIHRLGKHHREELGDTYSKKRSVGPALTFPLCLRQIPADPLTRSCRRIDTSLSFQTAWGAVKLKATCKYLILTLDSNLKWKEHLEETRQKATGTVKTLSSLGSSSWGVGLLDMRRLYESTVLHRVKRKFERQETQVHAEDNGCSTRNSSKSSKGHLRRLQGNIKSFA